MRPGLERARERRRELVILTLCNSTSISTDAEFTELGQSLKLLSAGGVKGDTMYSECFSVLVLQL